MAEQNQKQGGTWLWNILQSEIAVLPGLATLNRGFILNKMTEAYQVSS